MNEDKKKKKKVISRLKRRFRLVIINDSTFEERWSYRLTGYNVMISLVGFIVTLIFIGIVLVSFTPLKEFIPEYPNESFYKSMLSNATRLDSVTHEIKVRDEYINNLKLIISGQINTNVKDFADTSSSAVVHDYTPSKEDSLLRKHVELEQRTSISEDVRVADNSQIAKIRFFKPVTGIISNKFSIPGEHYGVDLVTEKGAPVHAVLNGTVISSSWSLETGFTIQIQHQNNLISVYKHNSSLLKHEGDYVEAGDVISFVGNTGEYTTGPHLHFELWFNGSPVNPEDYINF